MSAWLDNEDVTVDLAVARVRELEKQIKKDRGTDMVQQLEYHLKQIKAQWAAIEKLLNTLDRIEDDDLTDLL